jgi:hypothetical protein
MGKTVGVEAGVSDGLGVGAGAGAVAEAEAEAGAENFDDLGPEQNKNGPAPQP